MELEEDHVQYEVRDGAAWITIMRPEKRNAMTTRMYSDLRQAFRIARYDDDVDVIVVTGVDPDFSVGGDLNESVGIYATQDRSRLHVYEDNLPFDTIRLSPKTTIAMVNGTCLGGAMSIMACTDLVVASEQARFGLPEARSGAFEAWGPEFLSPRISRAHINYLVYTGEMVSAEMALGWGLVNFVVPHAELADKTTELIGQVRQTTPAARAGFKSHIIARDQITPTYYAAIDVDANASPLQWQGRAQE
ncbi:enoyl-CoA hydratase/isomerase family protein [Microbacterium sp. A588]